MQAIIQGLTEFLPVSSSGHISLYQHFTGNSGEGSLFFSAVLHLGTLVAVFVAFRKRIWAMIKELGSLVKDIFGRRFKWSEMNGNRRMIIMIFFSCCCLLPFAPFLDWFEHFAEDSSILAEGICFLYTCVILFMSDRCVKGNKQAEDIQVKDSVTIGFMQGVAMLPGVSRSGSTISGGMITGLSRKRSEDFSFLMAIPAILGAAVLGAKDIKDMADAAGIGLGAQLNTLVAQMGGAVPLLIGFVTSAVASFLALRLMLYVARKIGFRWFAAYTFLLGAFLIARQVLAI